MDINFISMPLGLYVKGKVGQYKLRDVLANTHTWRPQVSGHRWAMRCLLY